MQPSTFQPGDRIAVQRFFYKHVGIYIGNGSVVHNDKGGGVVRTTLAEFSAGGAVMLQKRVTTDYFQQQAIAQRALSLIGSQFNVIHFNCEHAANWAQSGRVESEQLQGAVIVLLAVLGLVALSKSA